MDGLYDGQMGMTDGLAVVWMDSATDLRVDRQTAGAGGMTYGLVVQQTDMVKDRRVVLLGDVIATRADIWTDS